jgi:hypothetical protein
MAADLDDEFGAIDVIGVDDAEIAAANAAVENVIIPHHTAIYL